jgi:hypothetical protein
MTLTQIIYLTQLVENVSNVFGCAMTFYLLSLGLLGMFYCIGGSINDEPNPILGNIINKLYKKLWLFILILITSIFVPTKQTMYLMMGSSYLSQSNLPTKVSEILNLKLDDVLKTLRDKK